jgi:hypothetical protein
MDVPLDRTWRNEGSIRCAGTATQNNSSQHFGDFTQPTHCFARRHHTVHLVTINPDGTEYHEIIDAEANEKRIHNDIGKGTKLAETNPHCTDSELPHRQPNIQASNRYPALPALNNSNKLPMFQCVMYNLDNRSTGLALNYVSLLTIEQIGEKIMNTSISLSFGEIFAASPDLAAHFSEQPRKSRRPIENTSANSAGNTNTANTNITASPTQVNINSIVSKPL